MCFDPPPVREAHALHEMSEPTCVGARASSTPVVALHNGETEAARLEAARARLTLITPRNYSLHTAKRSAVFYSRKRTASNPSLPPSDTVITRHGLVHS